MGSGELRKLRAVGCNQGLNWQHAGGGRPSALRPLVLGLRAGWGMLRFRVASLRSGAASESG
jgi:hypothetical protein